MLLHPDSQLCWGATVPEQLHGESFQLEVVGDVYCWRWVD